MNERLQKTSGLAKGACAHIDRISRNGSLAAARTIRIGFTDTPSSGLDPFEHCRRVWTRQRRGTRPIHLHREGIGRRAFVLPASRIGAGLRVAFHLRVDCEGTGRGSADALVARATTSRIARRETRKNSPVRSFATDSRLIANDERVCRHSAGRQRCLRSS